MSQTKLGPTLQLVENEKHESHSFWFEEFQCSIKVDRRKEGGSLALTLKTPEGKVVISVGPQDAPRFVAQVKHSKEWNHDCEYGAQMNKHGAQFRFDYEPAKAAPGQG
jgi:hypothetical protein